MTTLYLLRHATSTANSNGILAGRLPGVGLSDEGERQSRQLTKALAGFGIQNIYSSPLQRCKKTIEAFARDQKLRISDEIGIQEMDYGSWSGLKLKKLAKERLWRKIKSEPMSVRFPDGESFKEAAARLERTLKKIANKYPKRKVLLVTHGDIIKMAVQMTLAGDMNKFQRIVIDPASLTVLQWDKKEWILISVNQPLVSKQKREKSIKKRAVLGGGSNV